MIIIVSFSFQTLITSSKTSFIQGYRLLSLENCGIIHDVAMLNKTHCRVKESKTKQLNVEYEAEMVIQVTWQIVSHSLI